MVRAAGLLLFFPSALRRQIQDLHPGCVLQRLLVGVTGGRRPALFQGQFVRLRDVGLLRGPGLLASNNHKVKQKFWSEH